MTNQVWATQSKKRDGNYSYRFYSGKRPTKASFVVGELDKGYNSETGKDTNEIIYRGNGRYPQPSFSQISWM